MRAEFKPLLAVTMGDPSGSGPEIVAKALADAEIRAGSRIVVIGDGATMREALAITKAAGEICGPGSRGITDYGSIVGATVRALRERGLDVFVVPAMGSHGAATSSGQT